MLFWWCSFFRFLHPSNTSLSFSSFTSSFSQSSIENFILSPQNSHLVLLTIPSHFICIRYFCECRILSDVGDRKEQKSSQNNDNKEENKKRQKEWSSLKIHSNLVFWWCDTSSVMRKNNVFWIVSHFTCFLFFIQNFSFNFRIKVGLWANKQLQWMCGLYVRVYKWYESLNESTLKRLYWKKT